MVLGQRKTHAWVKGWHGRQGIKTLNTWQNDKWKPTRGLEDANTAHKRTKVLKGKVGNFLISVSYPCLGFQSPHRSQERLTAETQATMKRVSSGQHNYTLVRTDRGPRLLEDNILTQSVKNWERQGQRNSIKSWPSLTVEHKFYSEKVLQRSNFSEPPRHMYMLLDPRTTKWKVCIALVHMFTSPFLDISNAKIISCHLWDIVWIKKHISDMLILTRHVKIFTCWNIILNIDL